MTALPGGADEVWPSRCGYHRDGGVRFWWPQCMGGAIGGESGCTCAAPSKQNLERRIEALEAQLAILTAPAQPDAE